MPPMLNCIPSSPPSDQESYAKAGSIPSDGSIRSPPETLSSRSIHGDYPESENSFCGEVKTEMEDSKRFSPTTNNNNNNNNNNNFSLSYKNSPSPNGEGLPFERPVRPWNSSPNCRSVDRDESVSPSGSTLHPLPWHRNSVSPDVSSEASRIPSHASSEAAQDAVLSPKVCLGGDVAYDVPFPFHDARLSPSSNFRLSNSYVNLPMNSYFRFTGHHLGSFQPTSEFLVGNPFLGPNDPKFAMNNANLGFITQQLHHLNSLSTSLNKIPPGDLHRMSVQQLQFLQNHLQNLPNVIPSPAPFGKFPDKKSQLSQLMQARKHPKTVDVGGENLKKESGFVSAKVDNSSKLKERKIKMAATESPNKSKKTPSEESMDVDNSEANNSDSDEVLSVGSVTPPPNRRAESAADKPSEATFNGSSSKLSNRTVNGNETRRYANGVSSPVKLQDGVTNMKTENTSNRTLKFSIDNILKSDFGIEDSGVKEPNPVETKKQKESEGGRTITGKKKAEGEKEKPVDLSQENPIGGGAPGTDTPMLWPAWVYCTRYSDRPSSGPRTRRSKNKDKNSEEKRPRTAFSGDQLSRLKREFAENRYLTERRRQDLAKELGLNEAQIKIWFQNKRAKMKKARGEKNPLALQLMAQGLYNHSTIPLTKEEEEAAAAELSD